MNVAMHAPVPHRAAPDWLWYLGVPALGIGLYLLYGQLMPIAEWVTALFPVARDSHTGEAIAFFVYDVPKVLLLLTGIVFVDRRVAQFLQPGKDPRHPGRQARRRGQSSWPRPGRADAVLLVLGGAALHRLRRRPAFRWA